MAATHTDITPEASQHCGTVSETYTDFIPFDVQKLTLMKIKAGGFEQEFLSEPTTPTNIPPTLDFPPLRSNHQAGSMHSSASRRSSSFLASHRSKMSMELTSQAEGKFFALMDLMSTASREASSLKESWARIIAERDALAREREELEIRVEEVTETLDRTQSEHQHHGHEHGERKRQVEKLLLELTAALTAVSDHKKRAADQDRELERVRTTEAEHHTINTNSVV